MASRKAVALGVMIAHGVAVVALDNGLALTPPMGYNTVCPKHATDRAPCCTLTPCGQNQWYDYTGSFNESDLRECVDAFVRLDLKSYGYTYWNLDDLSVSPSDTTILAALVGRSRCTS